MKTEIERVKRLKQEQILMRKLVQSDLDINIKDLKE